MQRLKSIINTTTVSAAIIALTLATGCGQGLSGLTETDPFAVLGTNNLRYLIYINSYTAFYPFSGNMTDYGPHKISMTTGNAGGAPDPALSANRASLPSSACRLSTTFAADYGGYLNSNDPAALDITQELSIAVWVNLTNVAQNQKIIGKVYYDGGAVWKGYMIGVESGQIHPEIWDTAGTNFGFTAGSITTNTWTHLALTWKTGGAMRAYVNGSRVNEIAASTNAISTAATGQFRIGAAPWGPSLYFPVNGDIDDIRIYNFELTAADIQYLATCNPD